MNSADVFVLQVYMGWLRLVGSLKSQVSFAEYSLFYRAILQKRLPLVQNIPNAHSIEYEMICVCVCVCADEMICARKRAEDLPNIEQPLFR